MAETTLRTMSKIACRMTDETTAHTTSQTIREVIPQTGVPFSSLKPNAPKRKQLGRKTVSGE